ncbi:putative CCR4-NOT transcription complex subunit 9 [Paratrimastix pyriformis]|uniref:CCR4-NOT transcription complex subunit 9 n=1 Tax=Paratrimastix pyriformis TaxID=342808 RepID=A0ABQ8UEQ3_9EUKA|nr:putative CCR4-NOT transcription complex subunit 9 [Paratrimastix pyriformis]
MMNELITKLNHPETRAAALTELSKKKDLFPDLAPVLWHAPGAICALLQEIISIYPLLSPPNLTERDSSAACNALALLQCISSHKDTRLPFLEAHIPLFLYPFLTASTALRNKSCEYLRLTSLGVIGSLVKMDEKQVINFLLSTEIIPLCLRIMESGTDLSRTVATFIIHKIIQSETGLQYVCSTAERFFAVNNVLTKMVGDLTQGPLDAQRDRLLRHILRSYICLAENHRARGALNADCLPQPLRDGTVTALLQTHAAGSSAQPEEASAPAASALQLIGELQRVLAQDAMSQPPQPAGASLVRPAQPPVAPTR